MTVEKLFHEHSTLKLCGRAEFRICDPGSAVKWSTDLLWSPDVVDIKLKVPLILILSGLIQQTKTLLYFFFFFPENLI